MNTEIWKPVIGFESFYLVSSLGKIKSLARIDSLGHKRVEKMLSPHKDSHGYMIVGLTVNGRTVYRKVHNLMLQAFVGPAPTPKHIGRHLNDVSTDNFLPNLAWGTLKDNVVDRVRNGHCAKGEKIANSVLNENKVKDIRLLFSMGKSVAEIAREYGVDWNTISYVVKGRTWKHVQ